MTRKNTYFAVRPTRNHGRLFYRKVRALVCLWHYDFRYVNVTTPTGAVPRLYLLGSYVTRGDFLRHSTGEIS